MLKLTFRDCDLNDSGMEVIGEFKRLKSFHILPGEYKVTGKGVKHLAGCKSLVELQLPNRFSDEIDELRKTWMQDVLWVTWFRKSKLGDLLGPPK